LHTGPPQPQDYRNRYKITTSLQSINNRKSYIYSAISIDLDWPLKIISGTGSANRITLYNIAYETNIFLPIETHITKLIPKLDCTRRRAIRLQYSRRFSLAHGVIRFTFLCYHHYPVCLLSACP